MSARVQRAFVAAILGVAVAAGGLVTLATTSASAGVSDSGITADITPTSVEAGTTQAFDVTVTDVGANAPDDVDRIVITLPQQWITAGATLHDVTTDDADWTALPTTGNTATFAQLDNAVETGLFTDQQLVVSMSIDVPATAISGSLNVEAYDADDAATPPGPVLGNASAPVTVTAPQPDHFEFINQPVDTKVNAPMVNANGSTTHIQVGAFTPEETLDTGFTGDVELSFATNPGSADFVVGGNPQSTMTATAVGGVADFSPIIINQIETGYSFAANEATSAAAALRPISFAALSVAEATSTTFDVEDQVKACPTGQTCTTSASDPQTHTTLTIKIGPGGATLITISVGGDVQPLLGCNTGTGHGPVITFDANRPKTLTLRAAEDSIHVLLKKYGLSKVPVCFGAPVVFKTANGTPAQFNAANNDYEGALPNCSKKVKPPCVKSRVRKGSGVFFTIATGSIDPRITF